MPQHHAIAIIGAGFGGIGAAIRLREAGFGDFVILERGEEVGGVWRDNRFPGAACDVQSRVYELAAAPNPHWPRRFARQADIWAYAKDVADRFGLRDNIRLNCEVEMARWDAQAQCWHIATSQGAFTAGVLVAAPGGLSEPRYPDLPGLDDFEKSGGVAMHTARWRPEVDLAGKRVAIVGTGASAIQVIPAIQPEVAHLAVFQRTPPWVLPRMDRAHSDLARRAFVRSPRLVRAFRRALYTAREVLGLFLRSPRLGRAAEAAARWHLRRQVADPALRDALTPSYRIGCKRILTSDDYYPALQQPNATLVPHGAARVEAEAVVAENGARYDADVIVLATGFHVADMPLAHRIAGRAGTTLAEAWGPSPRAHLGTTVAGFPNLFLLGGPNSGLGHNSVLLMMEVQAEHVAGALRWMERSGAASVEPTPEAQAAFVREVDEASEGTAWTAGCRSWYLDATGRNAAIWPGTVGSFRRRVAPFDPAEYTATA